MQKFLSFSLEKNHKFDFQNVMTEMLVKKNHFLSFFSLSLPCFLIRGVKIGSSSLLRQFLPSAKKSENPNILRLIFGSKTVIFYTNRVFQV